MPLNDTEKKLLERVLQVAGDQENMIRAGITKALSGENDRARRTYLWNTLRREAQRKIRHARRKYTV
jgi:hypothetical protein